MPGKPVKQEEAAAGNGNNKIKFTAHDIQTKTKFDEKIGLITTINLTANISTGTMAALFDAQRSGAPVEVEISILQLGLSSTPGPENA